LVPDVEARGFAANERAVQVEEGSAGHGG
jgi:hypothetical protein